MITIFIAVILVFPVFVHSQEPPQDVSEISFDRAYAEYTGFVEEYNKAHADYVLKRAQFLRFQSLKSRQDAFDATLSMLEKRDDVVISYLKVLRVKIREGIGIADATRDNIFFRIDQEILWYGEHRDNLSTSGSLEDLVADSKVAADRWLLIDPLVYEVMAVLAQGKITDFSGRLDGLFNAVKNKLEEIRNDEREGYSFSSGKFQVMDRWIFEADGKITRSKEKQNEADVLIAGMQEKLKQLLSGYNSIINKLTESQLYMNGANTFLKEIVRQIKTEE